MLRCHKLSRPLRLDDVCVVPQGVLLGHNPLAFYALLGLIADMRTVGSRKQSIVRTRRPVQYIGLSRTDLPDSMVRRLVEQILKLPPGPLAHTKLEREILDPNLELQKVGNRLSTFQLHARLTCVLCADDFLGEDVARAARGVRLQCEYRDIELRVSPDAHGQIAPVFQIGPP